MEKMGLPASFGEWVKHRRRVIDLTQEELAQLSGYSVFALRKVESGERRPSKQLAGSLAKVLKIPPDIEQTFIQVARGERNLERLPLPTLQPAPVVTITQPPGSKLPPPTNLPVSPNQFIGREQELSALSRLLADRQCRLLSMIGAGGIGKSRLSIEVAARNLAHFVDGVWFVSLATLNSPAFLVPAIADATGLTLQGEVDPKIQLFTYLRNKNALLVLDNAEHLLEGVDLFAELLEHAADLKLLVTSRERLNLLGEWVFEIQGLPVPESGRATDIEGFSSVSLFIQSARRTKTGFNLQDEDRPAVVHICRVMEGMPLGIELAAAWVNVLTCEEIAHEIERNLDFLATTMRHIPDRQRSLRAAFDHSWNLLSETERTLLSRLSVFQGGFSREAAEQVAGANLVLLRDLVSKSLVRSKELGRFDLHEAIRQYAFTHLDNDGRGCQAPERHSHFYLGLLGDREKDLKGHKQHEAIRELTDEIGNIRTAWIWAVEHRDFALIEKALRGFGMLHILRGWFKDGITQLDQLKQAIQDLTFNEGSQRVYALSLAQQGFLYFRNGKFDQALKALDESLTVSRPLGDPGLMADSLVLKGTILHLNGSLSESWSAIQEGLHCAQESGDNWFLAFALYNMGYQMCLLGNYAEGYEQMLIGLDTWRALGDSSAIALGLNFLSPIAIHLEKYQETEARLHESMELCTKVGDRWGLGTAYRNLGLAALAQGKITEAKDLLQNAMKVFNEVTTGWDIAISLIYYGEAIAAEGNLAEARRIFLDTLEQSLEIQAIPLALDALLGLADLDEKIGNSARVIELARFVAGHDSASQISKDRANRLLEKYSGLPVNQMDSSLESLVTLESIAAQLLQAN